MDRLSSWRPDLGSAVQWFLSAVVGGAVVALVHQYFAVQLEQDKLLLTLRKEAYVDFFEGQAARRRGDTTEYETKVVKARFVIGVYGSKPTVEALWRYYDLYFRDDIQTCDEPRDKWVKDVHIYQRMRDELFGGGVIQRFMHGDQRIDDDKLVMVIHNCRLPVEAAN